MKTLRILFVSFSLVFLAGSVAAVADGIRHNNMDQVMKATPLVFVAFAAPAVANAHSKKSLAFIGLTRDEETLYAFLAGGKADPTTLSKYRDGSVRFVDAMYYFRKLINGLNGVQPIVDERLNKATGITNIHQGKLQKGENAVISQVIIAYATTTTGSGIQDPINVVYDSVVTGWPTGLANGHLLISQDGAPLCDPIPASLCGSQADSTAARGMVDSRTLRTPFVLEEEKQIKIEFDFPLNSFAANNHFIEIMLLGSKTRVRSGR